MEEELIIFIIGILVGVGITCAFFALVEPSKGDEACIFLTDREYDDYKQGRISKYTFISCGNYIDFVITTNGTIKGIRN